MTFILDFWQFAMTRKKFWLMPVMAVLFLVVGLLILAEGSAVAPFIYTMF